MSKKILMILVLGLILLNGCVDVISDFDLNECIKEKEEKWRGVNNLSFEEAYVVGEINIMFREDKEIPKEEIISLLKLYDFTISRDYLPRYVGIKVPEGKEYKYVCLLEEHKLIVDYGVPIPKGSGLGGL